MLTSSDVISILILLASCVFATATTVFGISLILHDFVLVPRRKRKLWQETDAQIPVETWFIHAKADARTLWAKTRLGAIRHAAPRTFWAELPPGLSQENHLVVVIDSQGRNIPLMTITQFLKEFHDIPEINREEMAERIKNSFQTPPALATTLDVITRLQER